MAKLDPNALLQDMAIYDLNGKKYKTQRGFPPGSKYARYRIPNTEPYFIQIDNIGVIIMQVITILKGLNTITDYCLSKENEFRASADQYFIELFATLKGYIKYHMDGDKVRVAKAGCYNFIAASSFDNRATVPACHIRTMDFHLEPERLQDLSTEYPILTPLIKRSKKPRLVALHKDSGKLTLHSTCLYYQYIDKIAKTNPDNATRTEMFIAILDSILNPKGVLLEDSSIKDMAVESLAAVIAYIQEYFDRPISCNELEIESQQIYPLRQAQIRAGIKEIYGMSTMQFIRFTKIEIAKQKLLEGETELSVALLLGYTEKELSKFERHFKQVTGISLKDFKTQIKIKKSMK